MMMEGDFTWGGEYTIQHTDDVQGNCAPETYIILLTSVTPINSIKKVNMEVIRKHQCFPKRSIRKITLINQIQYHNSYLIKNGPIQPWLSNKT